MPPTDSRLHGLFNQQLETYEKVVTPRTLEVAAGTIEEKVLALQRRKQDLFDAVVDDGEPFSAALTSWPSQLSPAVIENPLCSDRASLPGVTRLNAGSVPAAASAAGSGWLSSTCRAQAATASG